MFIIRKQNPWTPCFSWITNMIQHHPESSSTEIMDLTL